MAGQGMPAHIHQCLAGEGMKVGNLALLREAVSSLNSGAEVHTSERGRVELVHVLGAAKGGGVAEMDEDMEHRRAVEAARTGEWCYFLAARRQHA